MSIYYRLYQNKIKNSKTYGKFYARAIHTDTVDLDNIADVIERNCTLKRSDVKACLTELVEVMRDALQNSNKVRINGLGMFKINVKSNPSESAAEFKGNNISGYRVLFTPEYTIVKAKGTTVNGKTTGTHVNSYYLFEGISAKRASQLESKEAATDSTDDSGQSGSSTTADGSDTHVNP